MEPGHHSDDASDGQRRHHAPAGTSQKAHHITRALLVEGTTFTAYTATTQQVALLGTLTHPGSLATTDFILIA